MEFPKKSRRWPNTEKTVILSLASVESQLKVSLDHGSRGEKKGAQNAQIHSFMRTIVIKSIKIQTLLGTFPRKSAQNAQIQMLLEELYKIQTLLGTFPTFLRNPYLTRPFCISFESKKYSKVLAKCPRVSSFHVGQVPKRDVQT